MAPGYSLIISNDAVGSNDEAKHEPQKSLWLLFASFLACSLTTGIIPAQTLFTDMFASAGIFSYICANEHQKLGCDEQYLQIGMLLNLASVILLVACIVTGYAFDRWGGQLCAVVGSFMVAVAFFLMAILIMLIPALPSQNVLLSYTIICLVLVADIGAALASFALLGLMWHYPNHQSLISSLLNASYQVGALFAVGVQSMMLMFKVNLALPLFGWSMAQVLLCLWLWKVIPSKEDYQLQAKQVLGIPLQSSEDQDIWCKIKLACAVLQFDFFAHSALALIFMIGLTMGYYYQAIAIPFANALFHSKNAGEHFGTMCSLMNGMCGLFVIPLVGYLADNFGLGVAISTQALLPALFGFTCSIKSWSFATIAAASLFSYYSASYLLVSRWFLYFAPPNRLGMVIGVFQASIAPFGYMCSTFLVSLTDSTPDGHRKEYKDKISSIFLMISLSSMVVGGLFAFYYWIFRPCPALPRLMPEDEEVLARFWGFNSLEEIGEALDISDQAELINRLATTNVDDIKQLNVKLKAVS